MRIDPKTAAHLDRAGTEFTLAVLREEASHHPKNAEALTELANLLARLGRHEEGLAVDLALATVQPGSPIVHYNLSCTYARLARLEDSVRALRRAIELGFDDRELLLSDEDLASLRRDPRFPELLALLPHLRSRR